MSSRCTFSRAASAQVADFGLSLRIDPHETHVSNVYQGERRAGAGARLAAEKGMSGTHVNKSKERRAVEDERALPAYRPRMRVSPAN